MPEINRPPSAIALEEVLALPRSSLLRRLACLAVPDRSIRYKIRTGQGLPSIGTAIRLHVYTGGVVSVWGWVADLEAEVRSALDTMGHCPEED